MLIKRNIVFLTAGVLALSAGSCGHKKTEEKNYPYRGAIDAYCAAMTAADPDALMDCSLPASAAEAVKASPDHDAIYADGKKSLDGLRDQWVSDFGGSPEMSLAEVKKETRLTEEQCGCAEDYLISAAADYGVALSDVDVTEGYETDLTLSLKGSEYETEMNKVCCVVNVSGDGWKLITSPADKLK